jgi:hypothetical protein
MTAACRSDCPAGDCAGCAFPPTSCMGGWCTRRDRCALYLSDDHSFQVERLCEPGESDCFRHAALVLAPAKPSGLSAEQLRELARTHAFPEAA